MNVHQYVYYSTFIITPTSPVSSPFIPGIRQFIQSINPSTAHTKYHLAFAILLKNPTYISRWQIILHTLLLFPIRALLHVTVRTVVKLSYDSCVVGLIKTGSFVDSDFDHCRSPKLASSKHGEPSRNQHPPNQQTQPTDAIHTTTTSTTNTHREHEHEPPTSSLLKGTGAWCEISPMRYTTLPEL